jgi:hypothetical protein
MRCPSSYRGERAELGENGHVGGRLFFDFFDFFEHGCERSGRLDRYAENKAPSRSRRTSRQHH